MSFTRRISLLCIGAILVTLGSSTVQRMRLEVQDWDCPPSPASCARPVVVGGFPFPFISDYHGISPGGRVDLVGAALGMDRFHVVPFLLNAMLYAAGGAGAWWAVRRIRSRPGSG